jgi:hypothetical protein
MDIKLLEELQQPDDGTLRFTPVGLGPKISAEDAAVFQQQSIAHLDLDQAVPERVHEAYEQLRGVYAYGVLWYDFYTVAHDRARLILEYALRERLLEFYNSSVVFIDATGTEHTLQPANYEELYEEIHKGNRLRGKHRWRLRVNPAGETIYFDGMLDTLLRWARTAGLLHGQRNRSIETLLKKFRNHAAHATGYHLVTPPDAAIAIADLAEIINRLWNARTPGGRLYPAPVPRVASVVCWNGTGSIMAGRAEDFRAELAEENLTCVVVLAKEHDPDLLHFDAHYEATQVPADLLWGPGSPADAQTWIEQNQPEADEVTILDRLFMVRYHDGRLYLPRNPDIAAGLPAPEQTGNWYLVRADSPLDVFNHLRQLIAGGFGCTQDGHCKRGCAIETIHIGTWLENIDALAANGTPPTPRQVADTRTPSRQPRWNQDLADGSWSVPPT